MKYGFVEVHRKRLRIAAMCRVLGVSRSGFYEWRARGESEHERDDRRLLGEI